MRKRLGFYFVLLSFLLFPTGIVAANYTWDILPSGGYQAGGGTWGIDSYWSTDGITLVAWPGAGNTATFAGSDGSYSITVNGTQTANGLTFSNSAYTLSGGIISLVGAPVNVAGGVDATISSVISGSSGLTLSGGGTLTLSGSNNYTGVTTISAGTLSVTLVANGGANSSIGASTSLPDNLVINNGTLRYTGAPNITTNRRFTLGTGGGTMDASGTAGYLYFSVNSSVVMSGIGSRTFTLTGSNTSVNNRIGNTIGDDASLNPTYIVKNGPGTWQFTRNNTYTGSTTINEGVLSIGAIANGGVNSRIGKSSSAASNLVLNGGTLRYSGGAVSVNRLFTLGTNGGGLEASGTGILTLNNTGAVAIAGIGARTLTFTGTYTGNNTLASIIANDASANATSVFKSDVGTWVLTANNTYTGVTTIEGGLLGTSILIDGGFPSGIGMTSSAAANLVLNGGGLKYTGSGSDCNRSFTLGISGGTLDASGTGAIHFTNTGAVRFRWSWHTDSYFIRQQHR